MITCGDNAELFADFDDASVDHVVTDPPYGDQTHNKQRRRFIMREGVRGKDCNANRINELGFEPITADHVGLCAREFARVCRRWILVFTDDQTGQVWRDAFAAAGLENVRTMVWIKRGATPQFTGDRPAQGHELIIVAHPKGKKRWNGGGKHGVYEVPIVLNRDHGSKRLHTTQKPLVLMEALVRDFTDPGDTIFDPFCGSGTTLVAARRLGREAIGIEKDRKYAAIAKQRLSAVREQRELF